MELLITQRVFYTSVAVELSQLLNKHLYCHGCSHKIEYDPSIYGTETRGLDDLFENRGDWLTMGFIDCYLHDYPASNYEACIDEITKTGFHTRVLKHVMSGLRRLRKYGVKVRFMSEPLFPVEREYLADAWLYLTRGGKRLRCHLYIDDEPVEPDPSPEDGNRVSFEVNMICL